MKTINQFSHQWNKTIFENRNKGYGAYVLRETYEERVKRALLLGFAFITTVIGAPLIIGHYLMTEAATLPDKIIIFDPQLIKENVIKVKPPEQQIKPPANSGKQNTSFVAARDTSNTPVDTTSVIPADNNPGPITSNSIGTSDSPTPPETGGTLPLPKNEIHATWQLDKLPEFPGGQEAFQKFMKKNLQYPSAARENGIEGTVYISFIIDAEGNAVNAKLIRGVGYGLDDAVIVVVGKMPAWKPGVAHGEAVSTAMQLPIKFVTLK